MFGTFVVIQIIISFLLITVILLQEGKKGMGAIFGGSSGSIFGAKGAGGVLVKATTVLAILFMLNSVWIAHLSSSSDSVVETSSVIQQSTPAKKVEVKTEKKAENKADSNSKK